jgi:hypothetical protein
MTVNDNVEWQCRPGLPQGAARAKLLSGKSELEGEVGAPPAAAEAAADAAGQKSASSTRQLLGAALMNWKSEIAVVALVIYILLSRPSRRRDLGGEKLALPPQEFMCSILQALMRDPAVTSAGQTYIALPTFHTLRNRPWLVLYIESSRQHDILLRSITAAVLLNCGRRPVGTSGSRSWRGCAPTTATH